MEVGAQGVQRLSLFMAGKLMPSSHEPSHQWNQAPVTLIYQGKIKRKGGGGGEGWGREHNPKTKQSD